MVKTEETSKNIRYTKTIDIKPNDRVFISGQTGSGKTVLTMLLLYTVPRLVVIDSKDGLSEWGLEELSKDTLKRVSDGQSPVRLRVVDNEDAFEVMRLAYDAGNIIIYIDEVTALVPSPTRVDQSIINIWQRGRSRGIGGWACSQRPKNVPLIFLSEATHFFTFRLNLEDDRKRIAEFSSEKVLRKTVDKYGFRYYNILDEKDIYFKKVRI